MATKITSTLSPAQAIALSKITATGIDTSALHHSNVGEQEEHSGSVAVVLDYSFKVAADESYVPTIAMPYKAVLGLLASKSPEMASLVGEAMNEALLLNAGKTAGDEAATAKLKSAVLAVPEATAQVDDILKSLPKLERKGKIHSVNIEAQALEVSEVKAALTAHAEKQAQEAQEQADMIKKMFA